MREIDSLLVAPTTRSTSFPPLNRIKVGMPLIPYVAAVDGLSSTFSLLPRGFPNIVRRSLQPSATTSGKARTRQPKNQPALVFRISELRAQKNCRLLL